MVDLDAFLAMFRNSYMTRLWSQLAVEDHIHQLRLMRCSEWHVHSRECGRQGSKHGHCCLRWPAVYGSAHTRIIFCDAVARGARLQVCAAQQEKKAKGVPAAAEDAEEGGDTNFVKAALAQVHEGYAWGAQGDPHRRCCFHAFRLWQPRLKPDGSDCVGSPQPTCLTLRLTGARHPWRRGSD